MNKTILMSLSILVLGFHHSALANDINIIEVRRNIPLSDTEPVFKDFYLNAGESSGLKKNQILTMVRKVGVKDSSGSQDIGDLKIPVGQLKVIAIYPKLTVAREYKLFPRDELPMLEQTGLLIGDQVDLKNPLPDDGPEKSDKKKSTAKTADIVTSTGPI